MFHSLKAPTHSLGIERGSTSIELLVVIAIVLIVAYLGELLNRAR